VAVVAQASPPPQPRPSPPAVSTITTPAYTTDGSSISTSSSSTASSSSNDDDELSRLLAEAAALLAALRTGDALANALAAARAITEQARALLDEVATAGVERTAAVDAAATRALQRRVKDVEDTTRAAAAAAVAAAAAAGLAAGVGGGSSSCGSDGDCDGDDAARGGSSSIGGEEEAEAEAAADAAAEVADDLGRLLERQRLATATLQARARREPRPLQAALAAAEVGGVVEGRVVEAAQQLLKDLLRADAVAAAAEVSGVAALTNCVRAGLEGMGSGEGRGGSGEEGGQVGERLR
jgi:hypothetical protein